MKINIKELSKKMTDEELGKALDDFNKSIRQQILSDLQKDDQQLHKTSSNGLKSGHSVLENEQLDNRLVDGR